MQSTHSQPGSIFPAIHERERCK